MNILGKSRLSPNQWCTYIIFLSVVFYFFVAERYFRVSRRNLRAPLRANQFQASKTPQGNPKSFQADFPDYQHVEWLSADIVIKATDRKWHSFPLITITFFTSVLWQTPGRCICYSRSFLTKCWAFNIRWTVLLVYKTHLHFTGICAYFNNIVWLCIISTFFPSRLFSMQAFLSQVPVSLSPQTGREGGRASSSFTPMSDQDRISPNNISTKSSTVVMRRKLNINQGIISWSKTKFSKLTL